VAPLSTIYSTPGFPNPELNRYALSMGASPASGVLQSAKLYQQLIERTGLPMAASADPGLLSFLLMGSHVSITLENPHYLQMFSVFDSAGTASRLLPNTFAGDADSSIFLALANQINLEAGGPVKVIVGPSDLRFEVSSFLFGATSPARMGGLTLPDLTIGQVEPIFREYLILLAWVSSEFFQRARRAYGGQPGLPEISVSTHPNGEGVNYFQQAFNELGVSARNAHNAAVPEFVFAIQGFHFRMRLPSNDGWHFAMSVPFIEERRFDARSVAANLIRGVLTHQFLYHCNRFNAERTGLKCGAFIDSGSVYVISAGTLPVLQRADFAKVLPSVYNLLLKKAQELFSEAGLSVASYYSRLDR